MTITILPANAKPLPPPKYNLTGTWNFDDAWTSSPSTVYVHTMMINSFDPCTGAFSGIGYYTNNPTVFPPITWTITGTESGNTINFVLTITSAFDSGPPFIGTGTLTSATSMSGTGSQTGTGFTWTATKGTKVLDISYIVTNDEDSGFVGYWALDTYLKTVQVWQDPNVLTNFYVIATYLGLFQTFKGALSPEAGTLEPCNGIGVMQGGYFASFTATGFTLESGFVGTYNFGGTKADILLGSYGAGQTGDLTATFSWTSYFTGYSDFSYINWGWTYYYGSQTWVNALSGSYGDIIT